MMRSLFSGVAGLKSHQTRMDTVGNNISNVNTVGFKSSRTTFADTLYQTMAGASGPTDTQGGTNPKQIGLGTGVASIDTIFTDGSVQSTGKNTDLCLSGSGLFVVKNGSGTYYTRDGAFEFDSKGNYVLPGSGLFVQGWMGNNGSINTSAEPTNIQIAAGKSMAASATTLASYANNLNSGATTIVSITGGDNAVTKTKTYSSAKDGTVTSTTANPVTLTLADGSTVTGTAGTKYTVGDKYTKTYSATGDSATGTTSLSVDLTLADGTSVAGTTGTTYTVGSNYTYRTTTAGDSIKAITNRAVNVTLADGHVISNTSGDNTAYTVGTKYTYSPNSVTVDTSTQTVTLTMSDGTTQPGVNGTTYTNGGSIAGVTGTIASISVSSAATQLESQTKINSLTTSQAITAMSAPYTASATATASNPVTITMSDGTTQTETSGSYNVGYSMPVVTTLTAYDSLGNAHTIPVYFTKTKTDSTSGNQWTVSIATDGTGNSSITEKDGTVTSIAMPDATLQFDTNGKYTSGSGNVALTLTNGATGSQTVNLDLTKLTQYSGGSTVAASANGNAAGTLKSVSVDSSGIITGTYTNGITQAEAQVAIAQFNNPAGLTKNGSNLYTKSNNSGEPNVKAASALGVTITPSALEMSNVDIANEFSDMIITQRGFQSNSKIITVGDEMLETLINMKR